MSMPDDRSRLDMRALAQGRIRAYQGHSADCGHDLDHMCPQYSEAALRSLEREFQSPFLWHGTDLHVVSGVMDGVVPGGGPGGRLACHWVTETPPKQWERSQRGFGQGHRPHPGVDSHLG